MGARAKKKKKKYFSFQFFDRIFFKKLFPSVFSVEHPFPLICLFDIRFEQCRMIGDDLFLQRQQCSCLVAFCHMTLQHIIQHDNPASGVFLMSQINPRQDQIMITFNDIDVSLLSLCIRNNLIMQSLSVFKAHRTENMI